MKQNKLQKHYNLTTSFCLDLTNFKTISIDTSNKIFDGMKVIIKLETTKNRINFDYTIYKLLQLFGTPEEQKLLSFIYLQSDTTVKKHDNNWKAICEKINIVFQPTKIYSP